MHAWRRGVWTSCAPMPRYRRGMDAHPRSNMRQFVRVCARAGRGWGGAAPAVHQSKKCNRCRCFHSVDFPSTPKALDCPHSGRAGAGACVRAHVGAAYAIKVSTAYTCGDDTHGVPPCRSATPGPARPGTSCSQQRRSTIATRRQTLRVRCAIACAGERSVYQPMAAAAHIGAV